MYNVEEWSVLEKRTVISENCGLVVKSGRDNWQRIVDSRVTYVVEVWIASGLTGGSDSGSLVVPLKNRGSNHRSH